jgi:hypothetical protein
MVKFLKTINKSALIVAYNVGGMVSCRLRATFLSNYTELQAGGNASI